MTDGSGIELTTENKPIVIYNKYTNQIIIILFEYQSCDLTLNF